LEWGWEQRVPELDTPTIQRSVFLLPGHVTKNGRPRLAVLNDVAESIVDAQRSEHETCVFTFLNFRGERERIGTLRNSGWIAARRPASARYREELGREAPKGFETGRVTTHYSLAEVADLVKAANVVTKSRKSPTRTVLRLIRSGN
jgi:hypothetical protein